MEQLHIIRKERQNSIELGKAGQRYKLYFQDFTELKVLIKEKVEMDKIINNLLVEE